MMVTFISQCEKNALKRTRRVLDSFANRIGDNTWQTIITQEGLNAVQKLLRKTASKSTAVSCHWIRSRSRSDFLWVVGNKEAFDENGVVAVNYGLTKRFIGEKEIMLDKIYANTKGKDLDQRLDKHLFAVGYLAKLLVERLVPNEKDLAKSVYIAGCWHDMGKIDDEFQKELRKTKKNKSYENYPKHHEFSLLLFEILEEKSLEQIKHIIYWHHAKPLRKKPFNSLINIYTKSKKNIDEYINFQIIIKAILKEINEFSNEYDEKNHIDVYTLKRVNFELLQDDLEGIGLPKYKQYSSKNTIQDYKGNIGRNARNNIARTVIVTADRLISKLTAEELDIHLSNKTLDDLIINPLEKKRGLRVEIDTCLDGFKEKYPNSERNEKQKEVSQKLAHKKIEVGILNGPAGCGKTKIALEWALNTSAKKIYWICPRIQVCQGIFKDLSSMDYLPRADIEIVTGEIKKSLIKTKNDENGNTLDKEVFSSDIIITTIDQIVNSITTHKDITTLMDFMSAHVIFDEYHEYINMKGFNLLFSELIEVKKMQQTKISLPNTLLVSATPNPLFVTKFLHLEKRDIVSMESFNKSKYKINFVEHSELMAEQKDKSTFVINNIALTAQRSYIEHQVTENSILFHSKFTKNDKENLFQEIVTSFEKEGTQTYDILRSGPALQASLNITCRKMLSEMSNAEDFLQRLGRLDRFGEFDEVNHYNVAISEGVERDDAKRGKSKQGDSSWFLKNELFSLRSAKAWYDYLEEHLPSDSYSISEIYKLYDGFYSDIKSLKLIEEDLVDALEKSVELIESTVLDPKPYPINQKEDKGGVKIKKNSLRGNSLFVQMAKCQINNLDMFERLDEYAYENIDDAMTYSSTRLEDDGLLSFMVSVHHEIKNTKPINTKQRKNEYRRNARNPSTPIYLSYTPNELREIGGVSPSENALYYAIGLDDKPIGIISEEQLKNKKEITNEK